MVSSPATQLQEARRSLCQALRGELARAKRDAELIATIFTLACFGVPKAPRPNLRTHDRAILPR
jgi:hypothetical protein